MPLNITKRIIKIAEKYCDAVAIHPRTQQQGYSGIPDINFAKQVKKITRLPIIYSGNIETKEQADKMLQEFDLIMIGRKAMGNPNIFQELTKGKTKDKIKFKDYLRLAKKYGLEFNQIKFQAMNFTKGIEGAAKIRNKISSAKTLKEILEI